MAGFFKPIVLAGVALAAIMGGCGTQPSLPVAPVPMPVAPTPMPQAPLVDEGARQILAYVARQVASTRNWSARAHTVNVSPDGKEDTNDAQMAFKLPGISSATLLSATNEKKKNTKLVYDGKSEVRLKTYFFGFLPIKVTLSVTDPRLLDAYQRSLKDTGCQQFFEMMLNPQAQTRIVGVATFEGQPLDLLEIHSPSSWKGIDHEVVGISRKLGLPVMRDCYDTRGRRIFHLELRQMKTNQSLPADTFTLD